jgi:hypothetical protein
MKGVRKTKYIFGEIKFEGVRIACFDFLVDWRVDRGGASGAERSQAEPGNELCKMVSIKIFLSFGNLPYPS